MVLMCPDFLKPFVVHIDAALTAVGVVLYQLDIAGDKHLLAYDSRTLSIHERNYTITKREFWQ